MNQPRSDADRMRRRDLHDAAAGITGPRLLPWTTLEGRPSYLSTDGRGYLSTLADNIESVQLGTDSPAGWMATSEYRGRENSFRGMSMYVI
ncbi:MULTISPECIES: hypothetical protein [unclassified Streptomyces]|uniref:hypothetical protein n=1 Tax=unclassified Streptomyces TaxID=2593676 RepID=UPI001CB7380E|nr:MULTISPECIES: hypothetical protein [unclassified Streptomyces]